jgi:hypothetical protein
VLTKKEPLYWFGHAKSMNTRIPRITVELEFEGRDILDDPEKDGSARLQEESC